MQPKRLTRLLFVTTIALVVGSMVARAQQPEEPPPADDTKAADADAGGNPFGEAAPQPAAPPAAAPKPEAAPDAKDKPKDAAADKAAQPEVKRLPETNPAVLAALEMPRTTPADHLQVIIWLIDLDRADRAKPILEELTKLQLNDAQKLELVDKFGSGSMLKLARSKELAPAGAAFAEACMAVASTAANDPQRIGSLIKQLADPSPEARLVAQHDLAAIGPKAAQAALEAMAREADSARRQAIAAGVVALHPLGDEMLLAMLDTRDPALRAVVIQSLQRLQIPRVQPFVPATSSAAEQKLVTALSSYERGTPIFVPDHENYVEIWQWNDATKQLSSARLPADEARIIWMSKLARALSNLRPDNPDYRRKALVLSWEAASFNPVTRNAPAQQLASVSPQQLNEILAEALQENHPHAAVTTINAIVQRRDRSVLITPDGKPSPLANALISPNRNVRFAALTAIMALDPSSPYPGSSRVPEALAWFADSSAERRALIAMPTNASAGDLAGLLATEKLTTEATNRGRDLIRMAREMPDVEAIFVDLEILTPGIRDVLYELRINATTGDIPIAILAADGRLEAAKRLAEEHTRMIAVPRLHSPETVANTVKQLAALSDRDLPPANVRTAQAAQAKAWLDKLESGARPFYVIRRTASLLTPTQTRSGAPPNTPPQ
jgi:hypothetical protein